MALTECMSSGFNHYAPYVVQTGVEKRYRMEVAPVSAITHGSPIEFKYTPVERVFVDLAHCALKLRVKITAADGANIAQGVEVGTIANVMDGLIERLDVQLNDKLISDQNSLYGYQSYVEKLLTYGKKAQQSWMTFEGWYLDTPGQLMDFHTANGSPNTALVKRAALFAESREAEFQGRLISDIFKQPLHLIPGVSIELKIRPAPDDFVIKSPAPAQGQADRNYRLVITEARFMVSCLLVTPSVAIAHEQQLHRQNARYMLPRVTMKTLSIAQNMTSITQDNLFMGKLPERIVLGFVRTSNMTPGKRHNPWNFEPFELNYLTLIVNGECVPHRPYQPNFDNNHYITELCDLYEAANKLYSDEGLEINRENFGQGFALYAFDLSPDRLCPASLSPPRTGSIRLEAKFGGQGLPATVQVLIHAQYESIIEIDAQRNVIQEGR